MDDNPLTLGTNPFDDSESSEDSSDDAPTTSTPPATSTPLSPPPPPFLDTAAHLLSLYSSPPPNPRADSPLDLVVDTLKSLGYYLTLLELRQELSESTCPPRELIKRIDTSLSPSQGPCATTLAKLSGGEGFTRPFGRGGIYGAFENRDREISVLKYELSLAKEDAEELRSERAVAKPKPELR